VSIVQELFNLFKEVKGTAVDEGVYDNDVYKAMVDKYGDSNKQLSPEDKKRVETMLALPDMRPYDEDGTLEAWLLRISIWGKIKITQNDPANGVKNRSMSNDNFLDHVDNQELNKLFGKWEIEVMEVNKLRFYRTNWGLDGKDKEEEMVVEVDLRDDLKKLLKSRR
jgi:hypothetical protein